MIGKAYRMTVARSGLRGFPAESSCTLPKNGTSLCDVVPPGCPLGTAKLCVQPCISGEVG
jgi:hypothetical protein